MSEMSETNYSITVNSAPLTWTSDSSTPSFKRIVYADSCFCSVGACIHRHAPTEQKKESGYIMRLKNGVELSAVHVSGALLTMIIVRFGRFGRVRVLSDYE